MRPPVYKKVGLLFLARRWILVRQFLETFETLKLHQTLPLHGTVVPVNVSASGIHVIEHHRSVLRPSVEFRTCSVEGTR